MSARTFIVRVSDSPPRVVVEDVRALRTIAAASLDAVGPQIAMWLREPEEESAGINPEVPLDRS
jgi:hypothetical protein